MSCLINEVYDKSSISNDISEREQIIQTYKKYGVLDRQKAIEKIKKLRITDAQVAEVTAAQLAVSSTPFETATDQAIVAELQMQIIILTAKLTGAQK